MSEEKKSPPKSIRPLFQLDSLELDSEVTKQDLGDRKKEAKRVLKRLTKMIHEHQIASRRMEVTLGEVEIKMVAASLRDHANGGSGSLPLDGKDEVYAYCLTRLFEELVEEPSNILYATPTGPDSVRYDAMNVPFWIECLDLLEQSAASIAEQQS